jgi:hypothetical protein
MSNWTKVINTAATLDTGFIVLEHDIFEQTVEVATGYILPDAQARSPKLDIKPVIICLDKSMNDAYVELNDNSTNPPPAVSASAAGANSTAPGGKGSGAAMAVRDGKNVARMLGVALVGSILGLLI